VAKGARRPKSANRSLLVPFQPLEIDWFGRGELRTLKTAEPSAPATPLGGQALLSAFYLNELLLKLTTRDDPHEGSSRPMTRRSTALRAVSRRVGPGQRRAPPRGRASSRSCAASSSPSCARSATPSSSRARPARMRRSWPSASTFYVVERGAIPA
jgi:DNA repair protein RecO (recombination protein O)